MNNSQNYVKYMAIYDKKNMILIYQAITKRRYISFKYKGSKRTKVQPVALGFTNTGKLCLRAYDSNWKLFDTNFITEVELGYQFYSPKTGYNWVDDKQLIKIVVKL